MIGATNAFKMSAMGFSTPPDYLFIDAILFAYRMGYVRYEEQKASLLAAARAAKDAISFMTAVENFGVSRCSQLHDILGQVLAAPDYYRSLYPQMLGLRREGEAAQPFLNNSLALFMVEPVLTHKQQKLFFDTYWWFSHNHEATFLDTKKGMCIGTYATEPRDNASTLQRFEQYLYGLLNHKTQKVSQLYEGFPADIVMAIYKRAF